MDETKYKILESVAECLRTIAHPCRLRIIEILLKEERPVGELAEACNIPSHMASERSGIIEKPQRRSQGFFMLWWRIKDFVAVILSSA